MLQEQSHDIIEQQNDDQYDQLSEKVKRMKQVSTDIHILVQEGVQISSAMNEDMFATTGFMDSTMGKLKQLQTTASSKHMCYFICFIVASFVILYLIFFR